MPIKFRKILIKPFEFLFYKTNRLHFSVCLYCNKTSQRVRHVTSCIYYSTDTRENVIYLLNKRHFIFCKDLYGKDLKNRGNIIGAETMDAFILPCFPRRKTWIASCKFGSPKAKMFMTNFKNILPYLHYSRMRPVVVEKFSNKRFIIMANLFSFITRPSVEARKLRSHKAFEQ